MPSYCTDFYFLFSEFYMVTYVTDCQRQTPKRTTYKHLLFYATWDALLRKDVSAKFPYGGAKTFSAFNLTRIHYHFGNVYFRTPPPWGRNWNLYILKETTHNVICTIQHTSDVRGAYVSHKSRTLVKRWANAYKCWYKYKLCYVGNKLWISYS